MNTLKLWSPENQQITLTKEYLNAKSHYLFMSINNVKLYTVSESKGVQTQ